MSRHPELRALLRDEGIPRPERAALLRHLRDCAACRAGLAAEDPSRLFALLALESPPAGLLDRLSQRVADSIEERASGPRPARRGFAFASLAASLLLAGLLGTYLWMRQPVAPLQRSPVAESVRAMSVPAAETPPSMEIELLSSPGTAQVLDLSVGQTRLIMIFDEDMDI